MVRKCPYTGKRTHSGRSISRRGRPKYLGGIGLKTTGKSKRKFKANMQRVRALVDGRIMTINVSAKAIRNGLITKAPKRNYKPDQEQTS